MMSEGGHGCKDVHMNFFKNPKKMQPTISTRYDSTLNAFVVMSNVRIINPITDEEIVVLKRSVEELQSSHREVFDAYTSLQVKYYRLKSGTHPPETRFCMYILIFVNNY